MTSPGPEVQAEPLVDNSNLRISLLRFLAGRLAFLDRKSSLPPFHSFFEKGMPLHVEIGCGKGKFLLDCAQDQPGINFLGIDWAQKWLKVGEWRGRQRELVNLKFLKADVRRILLHPENRETVAAFHIYFPDPWPKRRHRRRRLVTGDFLRNLYACLIPGGFVELATDDPDYFCAVKAAVRGSGETWRSVHESLNRRFFQEDKKTNYELKYEACGRNLYYLELIK